MHRAGAARPDSAGMAEIPRETHLPGIPHLFSRSDRWRRKRRYRRATRAARWAQPIVIVSTAGRRMVENMGAWWPGGRAEIFSGQAVRATSGRHNCLLEGIFRRWADRAGWADQAGRLLYWLRQPAQLCLAAVKAADTARFTGGQDRSYLPLKEIGTEVLTPTILNCLRTGTGAAGRRCGENVRRDDAIKNTSEIRAGAKTDTAGKDRPLLLPSSSPPQALLKTPSKYLKSSRSSSNLTCPPCRDGMSSCRTDKKSGPCPVGSGGDIFADPSKESLHFPPPSPRQWKIWQPKNAHRPVGRVRFFNGQPYSVRCFLPAENLRKVSYAARGAF